MAQARPLVRTLFLSVMIVLFIACANLAGLLLVRVIGRRREFPCAWRWVLAGQRFCVNPWSRSCCQHGERPHGVGSGVGSACAGISSFPETLPRVSSIALDWKVVAFALGLVLLTGCLCGLVPAVAAARTDVNDALKEGGRTGSAGAGHARLRSALVIAELAVALVLLTASGLLLRSFEKMRSVDLGLRTDHMLTAHYNLPRQQYNTQAEIDSFNLLLRSKLEQLPSVQAVGLTTLLPVSGQDMRATFTPEGYIPPKSAILNLAWASEVMGNYFRAAGIPLL